MKSYGIDAIGAKKMVRCEIMAREELFCKLKADYVVPSGMTGRILKWFDVLNLVTAGNFAWSLTTARYHAEAEDAYPGLRAGNQKKLPG